MFIENNKIDFTLLNTFNGLEFYQKPYYLQLEAKVLNGAPLYYKHKNDEGIFLIPFVKRHIEKKYYDLITPYGYPGFLSSNQSPEFIVKSFEEFDSFCQKNNIITSFLRLHPFNNFIIPENNRKTQIIHGKVIFFSLQKKYEELYGSYSYNHKRGIKKLSNQGFRIKTGSINDIDSFMGIYNQTMDRLKAEEYYYFNKEYYTELMKNEIYDLVFIEAPDGTLCSSALFISSQRYLQYHLGGTLDKFLSDAPIKMIFDYIINRYSEKNIMLNLGGGLGGNEDNLFHFKEGFSDEKIKFSTLRMIHNQEVFNNLTTNFTKEERKDLTDFFPLYRK